MKLRWEETTDLEDWWEKARSYANWKKSWKLGSSLRLLITPTKTYPYLYCEFTLTATKYSEEDGKSVSTERYTILRYDSPFHRVFRVSMKHKPPPETRYNLPLEEVLHLPDCELHYGYHIGKLSIMMDFVLDFGSGHLQFHFYPEDGKLELVHLERGRCVLAGEGIPDDLVMREIQLGSIQDELACLDRAKDEFTPEWYHRRRSEIMERHERLLRGEIS